MVNINAASKAITPNITSLKFGLLAKPPITPPMTESIPIVQVNCFKNSLTASNSFNVLPLGILHIASTIFDIELPMATIAAVIPTRYTPTPTTAVTLFFVIHAISAEIRPNTPIKIYVTVAR